MFASRVTETVEMEGGVVEIRKLSWKMQEKAATVTQKKLIAMSANSADLAPLMESVREKAEEEKKAKAARDAKLSPDERDENKRQAQFGVYDMATVLGFGVKSYKIGDGNRVKDEEQVNAFVDDLPTDDAQLLHRRIMELTIPSKAVAEAERGNVSGISTGS